MFFISMIVKQTLGKYAESYSNGYQELILQEFYTGKIEKYNQKNLTVQI